MIEALAADKDIRLIASSPCYKAAAPTSITQAGPAQRLCALHLFIWGSILCSESLLQTLRTRAEIVSARIFT